MYQHRWVTAWLCLGSVMTVLGAGIVTLSDWEYRGLVGWGVLLLGVVVMVLAMSRGGRPRNRS